MMDGTDITVPQGDARRLQLIACKVVQREAYFCAARSKNIVDIVLMPQGLHDEPDRLRREVQAALTRTQDIQGRPYDATLLGYGFNFFDSKTFFKKGETVQTVDVWKGAARTVKAGVAADFATALPKRTSGEYQTRVVLAEADVVAPVAAGAALGQVELVGADGKVVMQAPLVALEAVEEGGFFRRMWDSIRLLFRGLFG